MVGDKYSIVWSLHGSLRRSKAAASLCAPSGMPPAIRGGSSVYNPVAAATAAMDTIKIRGFQAARPQSDLFISGLTKARSNILPERAAEARTIQNDLPAQPRARVHDSISLPEFRGWRLSRRDSGFLPANAGVASCRLAAESGASSDTGLSENSHRREKADCAAGAESSRSLEIDVKGVCVYSNGEMKASTEWMMYGIVSRRREPGCNISPSRVCRLLDAYGCCLHTVAVGAERAGGFDGFCIIHRRDKARENLQLIRSPG